MSVVFEPRPCAKCPFRKDAPVELWHKSEFERVLRDERSATLGAVFGCHRHGMRHRGGARVPICAGWALDQVKRGVPSIALRLAFVLEGDDGSLDAVTNGGHETYETVMEMCAANGVDT